MECLSSATELVKDLMWHGFCSNQEYSVASRPKSLMSHATNLRDTVEIHWFGDR